MLYARTPAARMIAASNNRCTAMTSSHLFTKMSPEQKDTYEKNIAIVKGFSECPHCGAANPTELYNGCGMHWCCGDCKDKMAWLKPDNGGGFRCSARGCTEPVPNKAFRNHGLEKAASDAVEMLESMVHALTRQEMSDGPVPAPAPAPTDPESADPDSDGEPEPQRRRVGGKSGKWSEQKKADARASRVRNAAKKAKLESYDALLAENLAFKDEIEMLKSTVADLEARVRRYIHEVDDEEPDEPIDDSESDPEDEDEPMDEDAAPADAIKA